MNHNNQLANKGFVLSLEALLAITAFSLTCGLILNLVNNGLHHVMASTKSFMAKEKAKKMLYRELLILNHEEQNLPGLLIEDTIATTTPLNKKSSWTSWDSFLQLHQFSFKQGLSADDFTDNLGKRPVETALTQKDVLSIFWPHQAENANDK